jgi:nicotinate-nucleotide pyrophosphorylase (carboxylating)
VNSFAVLPPALLLEDLLRRFLLEDLGRGDRTTGCLFLDPASLCQAEWIAKEPGVIAGLPVAARVFALLSDQVH